MRKFEVTYNYKGTRYTKDINAKNQADAIMSVLKQTTEDGIHVSKNLHTIFVKPHD